MKTYNFRLINTRDRAYILMPEHHVQFIEKLRSTTYKEFAFVRSIIDRMTKVKKVIKLTKEDWADNVGMVYYPKEEEHHDIAQSMANAMTKRKEKASAFVNNVMTNELSDQKEKASAFVNDVVDDVVGKVTYDKTGANSSRPTRNRRRVIENVNNRNNRTVENQYEVGNHELSNVASAVLAADTPTPTRTDEEAKSILSVFIDTSLGISQVLLYLGGMHVINVLYLMSKKVSVTSLPNPAEKIEKFSYYFTNPGIYYRHGVDFIAWHRNVKMQEKQLIRILDDANKLPEIKDLSEKIMNADSYEIARGIWDNTDKTSQQNAVLYGYSLEDIEQSFKESVYDKSLDEFDKMSFMDIKRVFGINNLSIEFNKYFNAVRNTGDYTNGFEMEGGVSPLMNYPRLINRYNNSVMGNISNDFTSIVRMIAYYTNLEYAKFVSIFDNEFLTGTAGVYDEIRLQETKEFRRKMLSGLSVYVLFLVPTLRASYKITMSTIRQRYLREKITKKRALDGLFTVGELFIMSGVMITAHMEMALLSESMDDPSFHLDRSFTDTSISHYYTTAMYQLLATNALRIKFEAGDPDTATTSAVIAATALAAIKLLDFADDPSEVYGELSSMVGIIPLTSLVIALVNTLIFTKRFLSALYYG